jgi:phosphoglycolate phosphatase
MNIKNIIFDLDGTLIDSSSSILASFDNSFKQLGLTPQRPLTNEIIGPPLIPILKILSGTDDVQVLNALAAQFKAHYDTEGYKKTTVFLGIEAMLSSMAANAEKMYIATNKRLLPTQRIIEHLSWNKYFTEVYALDYFTPAAANKAAMVGRILTDENLSPTETIYIGDRFEDGVAADENTLKFAFATWGYNDQSTGEPPAHWQVFETPEQLSRGIVNV